jgi:hypothetical protein
MPRFVVALVILLLGASCGSAQGAGSDSNGVGSDSMSAPPPGTATTPQDETLDFSQPPPLVGTTQVASVADAAKRLPFAPVAPSSLGEPDVYVSDASPVVAFVYRDPSLGTYWVEERSSGWTDATLKSLADCPSVDGGCGDPAWTLTTLADGTSALQIGTPPATVVIFVRNGVRFDVLGPPDEFKESNGVSVANALSSAATSAR